MNYYFFLDPQANDLRSSIELFNNPPIKKLNKNPLKDLYIYAIYSNGTSWVTYNLGILKKGNHRIIYKDELPEDFIKESVFVSLFENKIDEIFELPNENTMHSIPEWRSNIKISSQSCSCSFQGEFPGALLNKNISLVSCSPMLQFSNEFQSSLFLVNLNKSYIKKKFKMEILDTNKNKIYETFCYTNTVNYIDLNYLKELTKNKNSNMFIFTTKEGGGVPIYFSRNINNSMMSIEHTHPPNSYLVFGDTLFFQKQKKKYWFSQ